LSTALEKGAKNAIMVSVACAAAGIIVGMVTLTGMGLKFSSLVLDLSYGIKALAILLIGAASLVLGMGLPVTASYIVLATLAGPALLDMGVPIMVSHMIVFWYSQDANVTPPVSLASFAGAGVAGANPMRTAFTSWKLAKGLYIIPIIMAYRPLLGMEAGYELLHWQVGVTMIVTMLGLIAFASAIERYFIRRATWPETILFWIAAAGLFWPQYWADGVGLIAFARPLPCRNFTAPPGNPTTAPFFMAHSPCFSVVLILPRTFHLPLGTFLCSKNHFWATATRKGARNGRIVWGCIGIGLRF
jgi:TRAP-type uncharacterized transport system fused permease subunit